MQIGASNSLFSTQNKSESLLEQLASGKRINSAKDDAAGLQIVERLLSQNQGLTQGIRNANDSISYAQVAESGLENIGNATSRIEELTLRAGSGILSSSDTAAIQKEINSLQTEIQDTIENTTFGGKEIFTSANTSTFQVGAGAGETIDLAAKDLATELDNLGLNNIDVTTAGGIDSALSSLSDIRDFVDGERGDIGAFQNRVESRISNLTGQNIAIQEAKARIADTDYAQAAAQQAANDVLGQSSLAVASQAREFEKSSVLSLLS